MASVKSASKVHISVPLLQSFSANRVSTMMFNSLYVESALIIIAWFAQRKGPAVNVKKGIFSTMMGHYAHLAA